jgi:membrane protein CcdC involved in cytochrome C biogenesis
MAISSELGEEMTGHLVYIRILPSEPPVMVQGIFVAQLVGSTGILPQYRQSMICFVEEGFLIALLQTLFCVTAVSAMPDLSPNSRGAYKSVIILTAKNTTKMVYRSNSILLRRSCRRLALC